jgi:drug/metabolite transporter (DMT)-like permease
MYRRTGRGPYPVHRGGGVGSGTRTANPPGVASATQSATAAGPGSRAPGSRAHGAILAVQYVLLAAFWGMSPMFMKIGVGALAPLQVALGRVACAVVLLLAMVIIRGDRLPRGRRVWGHLVVAAVLVNTIPFALFAYGVTKVTSVVTGIWNGAVPLMTMIAAVALLPEERLTRGRLAGLAAGFVGVLVFLGAWHGLGRATVSGHLALLLATVSYGVGFPYIRRFLARRPESVVVLACSQLLCATAQLAVLAALFTTAPASLPPHVVVSVVALGILGTGLAYVLNYGIIRAAGATVAATVIYLVPVFSTAAGVAFLGESVSWNEPVGGLVVVVGVAVMQGIKVQPVVRIRWPQAPSVLLRLVGRTTPEGSGSARR